MPLVSWGSSRHADHCSASLRMVGYSMNGVGASLRVVGCSMNGVGASLRMVGYSMNVVGASLRMVGHSMNGEGQRRKAVTSESTSGVRVCSRSCGAPGRVRTVARGSSLARVSAVPTSWTPDPPASSARVGSCSSRS